MAYADNSRLLRELRKLDQLSKDVAKEKIKKVLIDEGFSEERAQKEAEDFIKRHKSSE